MGVFHDQIVWFGFNKHAVSYNTVNRVVKATSHFLGWQFLLPCSGCPLLSKSPFRYRLLLMLQACCFSICKSCLECAWTMEAFTQTLPWLWNNPQKCPMTISKTWNIVFTLRSFRWLQQTQLSSQNMVPKPWGEGVRCCFFRKSGMGNLYPARCSWTLGSPSVLTSAAKD